MARNAAEANGVIQDGPTESEKGYLKYRRSIIASNEIKLGEAITLENVSILRPAIGLAPDKLQFILGRKATRKIEIGEGIVEDLLY